MKSLSLWSLVLCCAGALSAQDAVELPLGRSSLLDIGYYDIGYQSFGEKVVMMPKGWQGNMMNESGIGNIVENIMGRRALLLHSPWRVAPGRTFMDYTLKLPQTQKIDFDFAYAMKGGVVGKGKSDGVEFFCFVFAPGEEPQRVLYDYYLGSTWKPVHVDLSRFAGKECVIRLQVEPGPAHEPSFDFSYFADLTVTAGTVVGALQEAKVASFMEDKAIQLQMDTDMTRLRNRSGQGIVPSNRYAYKNTLSQGDGEWHFAYEGADCRMVYVYRPQTGMLDDFQLSYNGGKAFPVASAGELKFSENKPNRYQGRVTAVKQDGNRLHVSATYELPEDKSVAHAEWTFELIGKALAIEVSCDSQAAYGFSLGGTGLAKFRKLITVPYLQRSIEYLYDIRLYNARQHDWTRSDMSYCGANQSSYARRTDGTRNLLHDFAYIAYSPDPSEVLPNIPWEPSKYRALLGPRIMLDFWGSQKNNFSEDGKHLRLLKDMGVDHVAIIQHVWQWGGYDAKLPDHIPANASMGGDQAMIQFGRAANDCGYVWSVHENYIDFYPDAPSYDEKDCVRQQNGEKSKAWYNGGTQIQSFGLKCNQALKYARMNSPEIHKRYHTNAGYLDVHPCVSPSHQLDYDATQPMAANARLKVIKDSELFDFMRETHEGPLFGEGGGHFYWAGACDATEAQVNGGCGHIPYLDFDLLKLHPQMVNHGMGYYERWHPKGYSMTWGVDAGSQDHIDMYRAQELAYGHAGFVSNARCFDLGWVIPEHHLVHPAQALYGNADVTRILYEVGGRMVPASVALALDDTKRQEIHYDNGTVVYVNWDEVPWTIAGQGVLPQWGVMVKGRDTVVKTAFEARPGVFADYAECPEYLFADSRTTFDMAYLHRGKPVASVKVKSFKYLGDAEIEISFEWSALEPTAEPCMAFAHFVNKDVKNVIGGIAFQRDYDLSRKTSEWRKGEIVVGGPFRIKIPDYEQNVYDVTVGLYDKKGRMLLEGITFDPGRYHLGRLKLERNEKQEIVNVVLEGLDAVQKAAGGKQMLDFTTRVNPAGTMVDFGKIVTDGSVMVRTQDGVTSVYPYPRDKEFTVKLKTAELGLGRPGDLKLKAQAALTREDMGGVPVSVEGDYLVFRAGMKGAGRFCIVK